MLPLAMEQVELVTYLAGVIVGILAACLVWWSIWRLR